MLGQDVPPDLTNVEPIPGGTLASTQMSPTGTQHRIADGETFDSRHNVLVPKRLDCLQDMVISMVAGGPSHLWVYGTPRNPNNSLAVGKTLHELETAGHKKKLAVKVDNDDRSAATTPRIPAVLSTEESVMSDDVTAQTEISTPMSPFEMVPPSPMPQPVGVTKVFAPPQSPRGSSTAKMSNTSNRIGANSGTAKRNNSGAFNTREQATRDPLTPTTDGHPTLSLDAPNSAPARATNVTRRGTDVAGSAIPPPPLSNGSRRSVRRHMSVGKLMRKLVPKKDRSNNHNSSNNSNSSSKGEPRGFRRALKNLGKEKMAPLDEPPSSTR